MMHLVTGATGLLGSYVVATLLKNNCQVSALFRSEENKTEAIARLKVLLEGLSAQDNVNKIFWVKADVTDYGELEKAFESVDYVYHCAAVVSFKKSDRNFLQKINVEGTANVVNACLTQKVKKLCHVSSTAALGDAPKGGKVDEKCMWQMTGTTSNYSVSKFQAEMEAWRGAEEGLDVVIVNPSIILGYGDWQKGSAELFQKVYNGLKFYTSGINGFIGAWDVSESMFQLTQSDVKGERFVLNAENMSYKDLFELLATHLGKKKPNCEVKPWMLGLAWRASVLVAWLTNSSPIVTKESAQTSMKRKYYDNGKIKDQLNIEFNEISQVIKETCHYFLQSRDKT